MYNEDGEECSRAFGNVGQTVFLKKLIFLLKINFFMF
jgi:hypothetical protein